MRMQDERPRSMIASVKQVVLLSTLFATFTTGISVCNGGHIYQVFNALPPAIGISYLSANYGYKPKITCIALCNTYHTCLSMFYNETSSTCFLNDHASYSVSPSSTDLTFIGWKSRCDYDGKCLSSDLYTCDGVVKTDRVYSSCSEVQQNGVYYISPDGAQAFRAYCFYKSPQFWMIIQTRQGSGVNFTRGWSEYKNGFGNLLGSYWLGADRMHRVTTATSHQLLVYLKVNTSMQAYAYYSYAKIWDEANYYRLELGTYMNGSAGDLMSMMATYPFSTADADRDGNPNVNCAGYYHGGWWYRNGTTVSDCQISNLNGKYYTYPNSDCPGDGVMWPTFSGTNYSVPYAYMMIAPV